MKKDNENLGPTSSLVSNTADAGDSDIDLVETAKAPDLAAKEKLFDGYYSYMLRVAMRFTKDADSAHDIAQEAFIKAFQSIHYFRFEVSFESWLYRIVRNYALNYLREMKRDERRTNNAQLDEAIDALIVPAINLEEKAINQEWIKDALNKLSPENQSLLGLFYFDSYSYEEIAEIQGVSVGSVRSGIARANKELRTILGGQDIPAPDVIVPASESFSQSEADVLRIFEQLAEATNRIDTGLDRLNDKIAQIVSEFRTTDPVSQSQE